MRYAALSEAKARAAIHIAPPAGPLAAWCCPILLRYRTLTAGRSRARQNGGIGPFETMGDVLPSFLRVPRPADHR